MRDIATELIDQQERLAKDRSTYDAHCQECARYILDRQDDFPSSAAGAEGAKRTQYQFDSTAPAALDRFVAAMNDVLTPGSSNWHGLKSTDKELEEDDEVNQWFDDVTDLLFQLRYSPKANFASQQLECYASLGAFGTSVLFLEELVGAGYRYKSSHISEHFFMENMHGKIDADWRKYKLTARQIKEKFPQAILPAAIESAVEKAPNQKFELLHCVFPNTERKYGGIGADNMAFKSFHVAIEGRTLLGTGGFRTFPFIIGRYVTSPNEVYGRSPGMTALAEIKMLNEMRKTDLRARHQAVRPPWAAGNEQTMRRIQLKPDAINYGLLDANGNTLLKPLHNDARVDVSNDAIEQSRKVINDIFLVTLFQILVETPGNPTATEILERAKEKGALLAPAGTRQESESLGPQIEREIDIISAHGYFDPDGPLPMPDALRKKGGNYEIEYTSPLARLRKAGDAAGAERTVQAALPLMEIDPSIADNFDWDEYVDIMKEANGAPERLMRDKDEKLAMRQAKAQQQQMAALAEAAPGVSTSIKNIAQAQQIAG